MRILALLLASLACVAAQTEPLGCTNGANSALNISSNPALTVWTYRAFEGGLTNAQLLGPYAQQYGVNLGDIVICRDHSNALINDLTNIPAGWLLPNIVLGLDNVLEFLAPQANFTDFTSPRETDMYPLVGALGHFQHMKPFDYGLVSVYFNATLNPELYAAETSQTFNLPWFLNSGLIHKFVAINPKQDTAGLAFLMWTIAELGDSTLGITGKLNFTGGWRAWWQSAFQQHMIVSATWDDAYAQFESNATITNMMSSYGSSPASDFCYGNNQTRAIVSWYNNQRFGWAQVEAVGITKNSTNAWNFIDFLLSPPFQSNISNQNYMNPVNTQATVPACYSASVIQPQNVALLNTYITANQLNTNLNTILNTWQTLYTTYYNPTSAPTTPTPTNTTNTTTTAPPTTPAARNDASVYQPMMMIVTMMAIIVALIM